MKIEEYIIDYKNTLDNNKLKSIIKYYNTLLNNISRYFFKRNNKNILLEDIKSCAIEGLIIAINKFDITKNNSFEPYARLWIKAKIRQFLLKNITPFSINDKQGRDNFYNFYKKEKPQTTEYIHFLNAYNSAYLVPDEENYVSSSISPEQSLLQKEKTNIMKKEINSFEQKISDIEKFILCERILSDSPMTLEQISEKFSCSNQNISYKEKKILEKFKKHILNSKYKDIIVAGTLVA